MSRYARASRALRLALRQLPQLRAQPYTPA